MLNTVSIFYILYFFAKLTLREKMSLQKINPLCTTDSTSFYLLVSSFRYLILLVINIRVKFFFLNFDICMCKI